MSMFKKDPVMSNKPQMPIPNTPKAVDAVPPEVSRYAPKRLPELTGDPHEAISQSVEIYNKLRTDYATARVALEAAQAEITARDNKIQFLEFQIVQLQNDITSDRSIRDEAVEEAASWRAFFANLHTIVETQDKQLMGFFTGLKALFDNYLLPTEPPPKPEAPAAKNGRARARKAELESSTALAGAGELGTSDAAGPIENKSIGDAGPLLKAIDAAMKSGE
jgi:hypothetical protein